MIEVHFMFQGKDHIIECHVEMLFRDVSEEFAKKVNEDLDTIFFIFNGKKIDLAMYYYSIGQAFNLDFQKEKQRIDLLVFQENIFSIKFIYQGKDYTINAKLSEKMKIAFQKFELKANVILKNICFQKNGTNFSAEEKEEIPVDQIANSFDKEENSMTILVNNLEKNLLENESIGSLYPNNEENNSNFNSNNSINNDNNNYENPKIKDSEVYKEKKYNERDQEKVQILSSNKSDKKRNLSDKDDDDNNYNNYESNDSFIEGLLNSQNQREDNYNSNKKECQCCKCECSDFKKMNCIFILLIQFCIIFALFMLAYFTGLTKIIERNNLQFIIFYGAIIFNSLIGTHLYIFLFLWKREMQSKLWLIYFIPFIPTVVIYSFFIFIESDSELQIIITFFLVIVSALLVTLILRGKNPLLVGMIILLSSAIVLIPSILLFGKERIGAFIGGSIGIDFYIWILNCTIFDDEDKIVYQVIIFEYYVYAMFGAFVYYIVIYPFICFSKKCRDCYKSFD